MPTVVKFDYLDTLVSIRRREFPAATWVQRSRSWEMSPADAQRFLHRSNEVALAPTWILVGAEWHQVGRFRARQPSLALVVDAVARSQRLLVRMAVEA